MLKIGNYPFQAVAKELYEGCGLLQQAIWCSAAIDAAQLRFQDPVEVRIRVALQCVCRQVEHLDLVLPRLHSGDQFYGMVCPEVVANEKDLVTFAILHESLHEAESRHGRSGTLKDLETNHDHATDARDNSQAKAIASGRQHRRVACRGIASNTLNRLRHRHLVSQIEDPIFLLALACNQAVNLLHPVLYIPGLLLEGAGGEALRRVSPVHRVLARRVDRHFDAKLNLNAAMHDPSIPQCKRQASCRERLRSQDRSKHLFLRQRQGATRQVGESLFNGNHACITFSREILRPAIHAGGVQAHDSGDLAPGQTQLLALAHGLAAQGLKCIRGKISGVDLVHG